MYTRNRKKIVSLWLAKRVKNLGRTNRIIVPGPWALSGKNYTKPAGALPIFSKKFCKPRGRQRQSPGSDLMARSRSLSTEN
jgi:hypothetical protein